MNQVEDAVLPKSEGNREMYLRPWQMIRSTLLNDVGCWVGLTVSTHLLFTIYKQKPVGTRFVQIVSKNSRMGNSVGIGVYHLQNSFKFTEGVWSGGKVVGECKTRFRLEIPFGNFGLPFKKSRFLRKCSVWENQNRLTIYIPTEIFGFLW